MSISNKASSINNKLIFVSNIWWENQAVYNFHALLTIDASDDTVNNCITNLLTIPLGYVLVSINYSSI